MNNYKQLLKKIDSFVETIRKKYHEGISKNLDLRDCRSEPKAKNPMESTGSFPPRSRFGEAGAALRMTPLKIGIFRGAHDLFSCKKGCADCCIAGITVWQVEYDNILDYLKKQGIHIPPSPKGSENKCRFLDAQMNCAIYDARPIVCRLWGMPMARDEGDVNCCEKNFVDSIKYLKKPDIINVEVILKTLAAINHFYCKKRGLDPEKRFVII